MANASRTPKKQQIIEPPELTLHGGLEIRVNSRFLELGLTCEHYAVVVARSESAPMRLDETVVCTFVWPNGEKCGWTRTTLGRKLGPAEHKARERIRGLSWGEREDTWDNEDESNRSYGASHGLGEVTTRKPLRR